MDKMKLETPNLTAKNLAKIAEIFPGVVTEGKVNIDLLRTILGEDIFGDEAYEFTWVGKRAAIVEAGRPIRKTLRPCMEESKNWDTTGNLYIEGDNLDVLKLLQESYLGKVKMIYIDPPYNTGNDFIYRDDFKQSREEYDEETGAVDEEGDRLFKNTETNGRFHSDWCSMMYPRLVLARNLLRDDGVIFISIDDKEVDNLMKIGQEVFSEANFVGNLIWQSRTSISNDYEISANHNHTLVFAKNRISLIFGGDAIDKDEYTNNDNDPRGPWKLVPIDANHVGGDTYYPIINPKTGVEYYPPNGRIWAYNESGFKALLADGRIKFGMNGNSSPKRKLYYQERMAKGDKKTPSSLLIDAGTTKDGTTEIMQLFDGKKMFDYPKSTKFISRLLNYGTTSDSIVLDFFAGSSTTADAIMQLNGKDNGNRKFIMVQLPENLEESLLKADNNAKPALRVAIDFLRNSNKSLSLSEIGKERIRRAGDKVKAEAGLTAQNLDIGFRVLKLDDTNMNDVYYAAGDYTQDMISMLQSNIKEDRTDMDLLFGCLLDWGLPLSLPHTHEEIEGFTVHTYNEGDLMACFEERISEKVVREIAKRQPLRVVFRDSSFTSSPEKINVVEIFKLLAPNTTVRVI